MSSTARRLLLLMLAAAPCPALTPSEVLVVANGRSPVSRSIAEYYSRRRGIPAGQILYLSTAPEEEISRETFQREIASPVAAFLRKQGWVERILVIVTTSGVPLKIRGTAGTSGDAASVDSELACLYQTLRGAPMALGGPARNPYFLSARPFRHPEFPIYLVTRLAGYSFADVRGMVDRALQAENRGVIVLDQKDAGLDDGNLWLKRAANRLPVGRVLLEESANVVQGARAVIGYASWGSNDRNRRQRDLGFRYLPGAIVTEYVSTDGRTFQEPPSDWNIGIWEQKAGVKFWQGSPQSLSADFIRHGATGVSGHVYEPFLQFTPRPDVLFPAYLAGRTLAESFWAAIPAVSWMNIVLGDPLCRLAPPAR
ncbi:MAG: TIGR03790 family protein [Candidatus Solibacter usitatus]|nr:TIGR03790 family protein [Candidatus Solibacter usitatus]